VLLAFSDPKLIEVGEMVGADGRLGVGVAVGVGVGVGLGDAVGDGEGLGDGVALGVGVAVGVGVGVPGEAGNALTKLVASTDPHPVDWS
jgi:hypothetical protein